MIGSINLPFYNLFDKNSKTLASKSVIEQGTVYTICSTYFNCIIIEFLKAGIDINKPIIATCGSGVTACWISFAASLLGKEIPVYDVRTVYCTISFTVSPRDHGQNMLNMVLQILSSWEYPVILPVNIKTQISYVQNSLKFHSYLNSSPLPAILLAYSSSSLADCSSLK